LSKSHAECGPNIRLLQEHEISTVNGGLIGVIILFELAALAFEAGYAIKDQSLPCQWREIGGCGNGTGSGSQSG